MLSGAGESRRDFNVLWFSREKQDQLIKSHMLFNMWTSFNLFLHHVWSSLVHESISSQVSVDQQRLGIKHTSVIFIH